jgi:5-methylthioadenosine/S-adenosylhomocysteine deaminase
MVVDLTGAHMLPLHDPVSALVYAAHAADVRHVMVDGRLLVQDGELTAATGLDLARLRALAAERVPVLWRRAGLA